MWALKDFFRGTLALLLHELQVVGNSAVIAESARIAFGLTVGNLNKSFLTISSLTNLSTRPIAALAMIVFLHMSCKFRKTIARYNTLFRGKNYRSTPLHHLVTFPTFIHHPILAAVVARWSNQYYFERLLNHDLCPWALGLCLDDPAALGSGVWIFSAGVLGREFLLLPLAAIANLCLTHIREKAKDDHWTNILTYPYLCYCWPFGV